MTPRARANLRTATLLGTTRRGTVLRGAAHRGAVLRGAVLTLVLLGGIAAEALAQAAPLDRAELTRYARAYLALDAARDEYYATIARIHDDVGLARARVELDAKVAEIYAGNAISSERYGVITLLISESDQVRAVFEELVRQLRAGAGAP